MNKVYSVRLDDTDSQLLDDLARKEKRTSAAMLRILFQEGIEARELVKESERVPEGRSA